MRGRILFLCMYTSSLFIVKVHRLLERTLATEALVRTCAVVRSSTERRGAPGVGGLYLVARQNAGGDGEDDYVVEVMYMALWHTLAQSWRLFVPHHCAAGFQCGIRTRWLANHFSRRQLRVGY